jgi:ferredoxin-2, mitochondrial
MFKVSKRFFPLQFSRFCCFPSLRQSKSFFFYRHHCDSVLLPNAKSVTVTFVDSKTGRETICTGREGENLVHLAHANDIRLEGACECSLACSTCHVILTDDAFEALPDPPCEDEEDLLDLAFGLTATSRLGCQVKLTTSLHGTRVTLPSATRNFYVDGHTPKPH